MPWNWELSEWPNFSYQSEELELLEKEFLESTGVLLGSIAHIEDRGSLKIELLTSDS